MKTTIMSGAVALVLVAGGAWAQPRDVELVLAEGQSLLGSTVGVLNNPYATDAGTVGFNGSLADGRRFVWFGGGVVFTDDQASEALSGGESTMGFSASGDWVYSPSIDGEDGVYTNGGTLLRETSAAPGLPGLFNSFNSRPSMDEGGAAYWVAGFTDTQGGSSDGRVFYRAANPTSATPTFEIVYQSFEVIDGFTVGNGGVDFTYDVSSDGRWLATEIVFNDTPSTGDDNMVYLFDLAGGTRTRLGREGDATGAGDNFDNWDGVKVNNAGDVLIHGDTDGATTDDEFIAFNGGIIARDGDLIGGRTFGTVDSADLNNAGWIAAIADTEAGESLFFGFDADTSGWSVLLETGDALDFDGDGIADGTLTDFNVSSAVSNGLDLSDAGLLYLEIDYLDVDGLEVEGIIGVRVPSPGAGVGLVVAMAGVWRRRR